MEDLDCRSESCAGGGEGTADKKFEEDGRVEFIYSLSTWCTTHLLDAGLEEVLWCVSVAKEGREKESFKSRSVEIQSAPKGVCRIRWVNFSLHL